MKRSSKNEVSTPLLKENQKVYSDNELWNLIRLYTESYPKFWVKHQLESYNKFIETDIEHLLTKDEYVLLLKQVGNKIYKNIFTIENIRFTLPVKEQNEKDVITSPQDIYNNSLTYESKLYGTIIQKQIIIDVYEKTEKINIIDKKEIVLAYIPVMYYSNLCLLNNKDYQQLDHRYNNGGYFLVNGSEKVLVSQERMVNNRVYTFKKNINDVMEYSSDINSISDDNPLNGFTVKISLKKTNIITISVPFIQNIVNVPVVLFLYLLGMDSDKEIFYNILLDSDKQYFTTYVNSLFKHKTVLDKSLQPINKFQKSINVTTIYTELSKYLFNNAIIESNKNQTENLHIMFIQNELKHKFLPHLGTNLLKKAKFVCYMINRLILTKEEKLPLTNRDSYKNKRLETCGSILSNVFMDTFKNTLNMCSNLFKKQIGSDIVSIITPPSAIIHYKVRIFDTEFKKVFTTGTVETMKRNGVIQVLKRLSYIETLAQCRMCRTFLGASKTSSKLVPPRYIENAQFGYICPTESPEGSKIGLVNFLSIGCTITNNYLYQKKEVIKEVEKLVIDLLDIPYYNMYDYSRVFIDGIWIGFTKTVYELSVQLIELRRTNKINKQVGIYLNLNLNELQIYTDSGRFIRPLLRVTNDKLLLNITDSTTWEDLIEDNSIEMIDMEESQSLMIAGNQDSLIKNQIY